MKKKIVSLLLTGVLFASMSLTAFAADVTDFTAAGGTKPVETEGTVNYVDTTVYQVKLPTANCFDFTVDPQGILSATDTTKTTYTEALYPAGTAGYIVATEGKGAYINNKSSVPIKLNVNAYVESTKDDDATNPGAESSATLMTMEEWGAGLINSGIDNNMMLTLDITHDGVFYDANGNYKPEDFADETSIKTDTVNPYVIAITKNGMPAAGEKGTEISFALNKANYEFKDNAGTYEYKLIDTSVDASNVGDSVGLRLSGFVNTNADWTAFADGTEKIIVKTIFGFDKLSTDYEVAALDGRAHGTLADTDPQYYAGLHYDAITGEPDGTTEPGYLDYAVGQGAIEIPFDFGTGTKEVGFDTAIEATAGITVGSTALTDADYKINNNVISIKTSTISSEITGAITTGTQDPNTGSYPLTVTVITDDKQTTTITVNVYPAA